MATRLDDSDILGILEAVQASLDQGASLIYAYRYVARGWGVSPDTVGNYWREHRPTTKLATMKIQARASQIVEKIIEKAPTNELIDILSRPNIGVLEPMKSGNQGGGFIVSVSADSCGGVKVGVAAGIEPSALPAWDTGTADLSHLKSDMLHLLEEPAHAEIDDAVTPNPPTNAETVRARLAKAREQAQNGLDRGQPDLAGNAGVQRVQRALDSAPSRSMSSPGHTSKINLRYSHESFDDSGV